MFYEDIFREFNKRKIKYLIVGGLAVNLHGIPRLTQDLDLLVEMKPSNLSKLVRSLLSLGYKPRPPVNPMDLANPRVREKWIKKKNMKVFTFFHPKIPAQEVDVLVFSPVNFENAYKNRQVKKADDLKIPVVSISDLIKMKEKLGRKTDISDVRMLKLILRTEK